jgi:hypothetical protein
MKRVDKHPTLHSLDSATYISSHLQSVLPIHHREDNLRGGIVIGAEVTSDLLIVNKQKYHAFIPLNPLPPVATSLLYSPAYSGSEYTILSHIEFRPHIRFLQLYGPCFDTE